MDKHSNTESVSARFNAKFTKTPTCWIWHAAKIPAGYGVIRIDGKLVYAHRHAYSLAHGEIPVGMMVDHECHRRDCVNPEHLRLATMKQNQENRLGAQANNKSSGVRGVSWDKRNHLWMTNVHHNGKQYWCGRHSQLTDAAEAVRLKRIKLFTHNAVDRTG